jgi:hypothetical protein
MACTAASAEPPAGSNWARNVNSDGSSSVSVKQTLPTEWDATVGLDLGLAAPPAGDAGESGLPVPVAGSLAATSPASSAAGWARVNVPGVGEHLGFDRTALELRVDPVQEQARLGATLSRTDPLGENLSVNVRNSYSLTQTSPNGDGSAHILGTDNSVGVSFVPTRTTLSAGTTRASDENAWHNWASAEQKLFGGVRVTTTVSDIGRAEPVKSLTAGYKRRW